VQDEQYKESQGDTEKEIVTLVQALRGQTPYFQISHTHACTHHKQNTYTDFKVPNITLSNVIHMYTSIYLSFKGPTDSKIHLSQYLMDTGGPLARDKAGRL
jgi:hypothetical protein